MAATRSSRPAADRSGDRSQRAAGDGLDRMGRVRQRHHGATGSFEGIQGSSHFRRRYYRVTEGGLVLSIDYTVWGGSTWRWACSSSLSGIGVLAGNLAASTAGVILAGLSAITNLIFIEAYPVWSVIVITVAILVIYALTVHGRELKNTSF